MNKATRNTRPVSWDIPRYPYFSCWGSLPSRSITASEWQGYCQSRANWCYQQGMDYLAIGNRSWATSYFRQFENWGIHAAQHAAH